MEFIYCYCMAQRVPCVCCDAPTGSRLVLPVLGSELIMPCCPSCYLRPGFEPGFLNIGTEIKP